jgi:hypothetical protein
MPDSFLGDIEYLGKVMLITFILLSLMVIYNQKVVEGIILLTFAIQITLIWLLANKYDLKEFIEVLGETSANDMTKRYIYLIGLSILFIVALSFIFRAIIIAQKSINDYGLIKTTFHQDIIFAAVIGTIVIIIFILTYFIGKKIFKNPGQPLAVPGVLFGILAFMSNTHIFHNF